VNKSSFIVPSMEYELDQDLEESPGINVDVGIFDFGLGGNPAPINTQDYSLIPDELDGFVNCANNIIWMILALPKVSPVEINIYDLKGRVLMNTSYELLPEGIYDISFELTNSRLDATFSSGIYFWSMSTWYGDLKGKLLIVR